MHRIGGGGPRRERQGVGIVGARRAHGAVRADSVLDDVAGRNQPCAVDGRGKPDDRAAARREDVETHEELAVDHAAFGGERRAAA
jgi:hypothetical protein